MKKLYYLFPILLIAAFALSACAPSSPTALPTGPDEMVTDTEGDQEASGEKAASEPDYGFEWDQDYIREVPPIMMIEPYFQIFGQSQVPVPYSYEDAVKLAGHSCGAVTGAWTITQKALSAISRRRNPSSRSNSSGSPRR